MAHGPSGRGYVRRLSGAASRRAARAGRLPRGRRIVDSRPRAVALARFQRDSPGGEARGASVICVAVRESLGTTPRGFRRMVFARRVRFPYYPTSREGQPPRDRAPSSVVHDGRA